MTKIQNILKEIDHLDSDDLELIRTKVKERLDKKQKAEAILKRYIGKGNGVWNIDAQNYINKWREDDRPTE